MKVFTRGPMDLFMSAIVRSRLAGGQSQCASGCCASISAMRKCLFVFLMIVAPIFIASAQSPSNLYPMQEGFVDSHGALIYYKAVGHGAPLMIVHGGPGASHEY